MCLTDRGMLSTAHNLEAPQARCIRLRCRTRSRPRNPRMPEPQPDPHPPPLLKEPPSTCPTIAFECPTTDASHMASLQGARLARSKALSSPELPSPRYGPHSFHGMSTLILFDVQDGIALADDHLGQKLDRGKDCRAHRTFIYQKANTGLGS